MEAARRSYVAFVPAALGRLKGFRNAEEWEANCGSFAISVVVFGLLSSLLFGLAAVSTVAGTRRSLANRDPLSWIDMPIGLVGMLAAYSSWASRWSTYFLSTSRRIAILIVVISILGILAVQLPQVEKTAQTSARLALQVGVAVAGLVVLLTNRGRLTRLASVVRAEPGGPSQSQLATTAN